MKNHIAVYLIVAQQHLEHIDDVLKALVRFMDDPDANFQFNGSVVECEGRKAITGGIKSLDTDPQQVEEKLSRLAGTLGKHPAFDEVLIAKPFDPEKEEEDLVALIAKEGPKAIAERREEMTGKLAVLNMILNDAEAPAALKEKIYEALTNGTDIKVVNMGDADSDDDDCQCDICQLRRKLEAKLKELRDSQ
jgi:Cft2 family RNA processing exonuclease